MYTPLPFKPDRAAVLAFGATRGFGTVCAWDGRKPVASAVPFCLDDSPDGTPRIALHLARNNPLLALTDGKSAWVLPSGEMRTLRPQLFADQVTQINAMPNLEGTM